MKSAGERAPKSVHAEIKRDLEAPIALESSGVGDRQANWAAEKAVQLPGDDVRVVGAGLEARLGEEEA